MAAAASSSSSSDGSSSSSSGSPISYIGTHSSSNEGVRRFFLLNSIHSKYTAINGKKVDKFMVYTSTGKNTKGICGNKLCIIPCFGAFDAWMVVPGTRDYTLLSPLIKTDYYKGLGKFIRNSEANEKREILLRNYERNIGLFLGSDQIEENLLREYFNDSDNKIELSEFRDFKIKLGSNAFLRDVLFYRDQIYNYINNQGPEIVFNDISFINKFIETNNYYGIDLMEDVQPYKKVMSDCISASAGTKMEYACTVPEVFIGIGASKTDKDYVARIIKDLLKNPDKEDKYLGLINSPPENLVYLKILSSPIISE